MAALYDGPLHGYALVKRIREVLPEPCWLRGSQVYVALRALERSGWASISSDGVNEERRVYRLTNEGCDEIARRAAEWHLCADAVSRMFPRPPSVGALAEGDPQAI